LDSEDFNHLWLCSKSLIDLQNIISQAKTLLQDTIKLFTTSGPSNMFSFFDNNLLWILPIFNQPHIHTFFSFIDLIKGIIPFCLTDALKQQGLSSSQVSLTILTPELQRSSLPSGFLTSAPLTQKFNRPTSELLLHTSMSLVDDF